MANKLKKGENCVLECANGSIFIKHPTSTAIDINLTAFLLDDSGKVKNDNNMVFFNQFRDPTDTACFNHPIHKQGITKHQIDFSFNVGSSDINRIAFCLTEDNGIGFSGLDLTTEIYCNGITILLVPQFNCENSLIVAEIYRNNNQLKARSVWQGFSTGLTSLCGYYGIEVDSEPETEVEKLPPTKESNKHVSNDLESPPSYIIQSTSKQTREDANYSINKISLNDFLIPF